MTAPVPPSRTTRRHNVIFWLAWIALPLCALGYQVTAKLSASALSGQEFSLDWLVAIVQLPAFRWMLLFEIVSFVAWIRVLSEMPLSEAFPLSALSYVLIVLASLVLFREHGSWLQALGSFAIVSGAWLISRAEDDGGVP